MSEGLIRRDLRDMWAIRGFRALFAARFVSNVGNGMTPIALAFGVLALPGGDATALSYVTASQMAPIVVFLLVGGVMADRIGRARLVGLTDIVGAAVVAANAVLFITGEATVLLLCVTGVLLGSINAIWHPAFAGLIPDVVPAERLQSGNALVGFAANLGFTIGASAAGVIVSTAGPGWAILLDAASFMVAGILVWRLRTERPTTASEGRQPSALREMREGWHEFRSRRWLVVSVASFAVVFMCFEALIGVLAPLQMDEEFAGAQSMGWMMSAFGAGSIIGVLVALRVSVARPLAFALRCLTVVGLWMIAVASSAPLPLLVAVAFAAGLGLDLFVILWMTAVQRHVPSEALSRVGSFEAFGSIAFAPLGLLLAGPLATWIGTESALVIAGGATLAACLAALSSRSVRSLA